MQAVYNILQDGSRGTSELLDLAEDYVKEGSWRELMQPLLPLLPEESLLQCCTHSLPAIALGEQTMPQARNSCILHLVVAGHRIAPMTRPSVDTASQLLGHLHPS